MTQEQVRRLYNSAIQQCYIVLFFCYITCHLTGLRRFLPMLCNRLCNMLYRRNIPSFVWLSVPFTGSPMDSCFHTQVSSFRVPPQALRQGIWTGRTVTKNRTRMKVVEAKLRIPCQLYWPTLKIWRLCFATYNTC